MAGVVEFGHLRFNTIESDELAQAIGGWMRHTLTPAGEHEAPAVRNITLKLVGILGHTNLISLTTIVQQQRDPKWTTWVGTLEAYCASEKRVLN